MVSIVCIYRGDSPTSARLVAASSEPELVAAVTEALLAGAVGERPVDPVLQQLAWGRRAALRLVKDEAERG